MREIIRCIQIAVAFPLAVKNLFRVHFMAVKATGNWNKVVGIVNSL